MLKKIQTILRQEGFSAVIQRAWAKVLRESGSRLEETMARRKGSYRLHSSTGPLRLTPRLGTTNLEAISLDTCIPKEVARHYLDHRFDLLGSGWCQVRYGMKCRGMAGYHYDMNSSVVPDPRGQWLAGRLNPSNLETAQKIWQRIDPDYQPIDWQLDFKSGYRWSEKTWAARLKYGHLPGVDVKVPWELSRMQHLPQMALQAAGVGGKDPEAHRLVRDIRNQWHDFIATNPPGFGVNWLCPMDISIRGANWCLAWDILQAAGFIMEPEEESILAHSLYDHGRYIVGHLEWSSDRANHYLSHICGTIFIATYLPETPETDCRLAFAIGQLHVETLRQFLPDGGNFEGSTAYHRLSTEMVMYAMALILGLPKERLECLAAIDPKDYAFLPGRAGLTGGWMLHETGMDAKTDLIQTPFSPRFVERFQCAVSFFAAILKQDGCFPQIGDNDSGRFFKLQPVYTEMTIGDAKQKYITLKSYNELDDAVCYYFEDGLAGIHLLNASAALGLAGKKAATAGKLTPDRSGLEENVIIGLATGNTVLNKKNLPTSSSKFAHTTQVSEFLSYWEAKELQSGTKVYRYKLPRQVDFSVAQIRVSWFRFFGCLVFHHTDFYLSIRCVVQSGQKITGHKHDDQLSLELNIAGKPMIRDPGSFVYTALPDAHMRYRHALSHFTPVLRPDSIDGNTNDFNNILVQPAVIDYIVSYGFAAHVTAEKKRTDLLVRFGSDGIEIMHAPNSDKDCDSQTGMQPVPYSPGYGIQERMCQ